MTRDSQSSDERIRSILADLLKRRLAESLSEVDSAMAQWRGGDLSVFEAHGEVLRHVGRAEMVAEQVGQARGDASALLRQAFDLGLLERDEFINLVGKAPEAVEPAPVTLPTASGLPPKRQVVEELLADGPVLLHIDARCKGASVPAQFHEDPRLVLRFGYQLTPPIVDFDIDDDGVLGTLTFGGVPHCCVLPWECIYAVVAEADQEGMVWPEDVPSAVIADFSPASSTKPSTKPSSTSSAASLAAPPAASLAASPTSSKTAPATDTAQGSGAAVSAASSLAAEPPRRRAASQSELDTPVNPGAMPSPDEVKRGAHLKLVK